MQLGSAASKSAKRKHVVSVEERDAGRRTFITNCCAVRLDSVVDFRRL